MSSGHTIRRRITLPIRTLVTLALASSALAGTAAAGSAAAPGTELWTARYDGRGNGGTDVAADVATSPDGTMVFVTGQSEGDIVTIAYDPTSGAKIWRRRYDGPAGGADRASAIAVSPEGRAVFVTGSTTSVTGPTDYVTVSYDATTGTRRWIRRYDGPGTGDHGYDAAHALAVSPDSATVFVTGSSAGPMTHADYATIAYEATTGARRWVQRFDGPRRSVNDEASSIAVSPDGTKVFVTGYTNGFRFLSFDYATFAYDASTGGAIWKRFYDSGDIYAEPGDQATAIGVSPDGATVFVTGSTTSEIATIAYDATTGHQEWIDRYDPGGSYAYAFGLAVAPDGTTVFVTGTFEPSGDYVTVAYDAVDGTRGWISRYDGPVHREDWADAIALSPDGTMVFVTGNSNGSATGFERDYATVAYDASTGATLWTKRYAGPPDENDSGEALAVSPDGAALFVTGWSAGSTAEYDYDYLTIAYAI